MNPSALSIEQLIRQLQQAGGPAAQSPGDGPVVFPSVAPGAGQPGGALPAGDFFPVAGGLVPIGPGGQPAGGPIPLPAAQTGPYNPGAPRGFDRPADPGAGGPGVPLAGSVQPGDVKGLLAQTGGGAVPPLALPPGTPGLVTKAPQAAFTPHFVTQGLDMTNPAWAATPEDEALINQGRAFRQAISQIHGGNLSGPTAAELAAASDQANSAFKGMQEAGGLDERNVNRQLQLAQGLNQTVGGLLGHQLSGQAQLGVAGINAQGERDKASIAAAAHANPAAMKAQAMTALLGNAMQDPNFDWGRFQGLLPAIDKFYSGLHAPGAGGPPGPGDGAPKPPLDLGPGGAAPAGGPVPAATPGADPLATDSRARQSLQQLAAILGAGTPGRDFKPGPMDPATMNRAVDFLAGANLPPEAHKALVGQIQANGLGNPVDFRNALARNVASNYLAANPPTYQKPSFMPFARRDSGASVPGSMDVPFGDQGQPLMTIGQRPAETALGRLGQGISSQLAGTPYNQITLPDGSVVPIQPSDVPGLGVGGKAFGIGGDQRRLAPNRASQGAALLQLLMGR